MKAIPETTGMYSAELSTERGVGKDRTWGNQKKKNCWQQQKIFFKDLNII